MIEQLSQVEGVTLVEKNFRSAVEEYGGSINSVMEIISKLLKDEDTNPETAIFILDGMDDDEDDEDGKPQKKSKESPLHHEPDAENEDFFADLV